MEEQKEILEEQKIYYAKKVNSEGKVECLWTFDNDPPIFTESDIGCFIITEEEYNSILQAQQEANQVQQPITGEEEEEIISGEEEVDGGEETN